MINKTAIILVFFYAIGVQNCQAMWLPPTAKIRGRTFLKHSTSSQLQNTTRSCQNEQISSSLKEEIMPVNKPTIELFVNSVDQVKKISLHVPYDTVNKIVCGQDIYSKFIEHKNDQFYALVYCGKKITHDSEFPLKVFLQESNMIHAVIQPIEKRLPKDILAERISSTMDNQIEEEKVVDITNSLSISNQDQLPTYYYDQSKDSQPIVIDSLFTESIKEFNDDYDRIVSLTKEEFINGRNTLFFRVLFKGQNNPVVLSVPYDEERKICSRKHIHDALINHQKHGIYKIVFCGKQVPYGHEYDVTYLAKQNLFIFACLEDADV